MTTNDNHSRLERVAVAVQHLYRDGEELAEQLGTPLHDGGWFPGTGVAHKFLELKGVYIDIVSVVDYHASRNSEYGSTVYETARLGSSLLSVSISGPPSAGDEQRMDLTPEYLTWRGDRIPSRRREVLLSTEGGFVLQRLAGTASTANPDDAWNLRVPTAPAAPVDAVAGLHLDIGDGPIELTVPGRGTLTHLERPLLIAVRKD